MHLSEEMICEKADRSIEEKVKKAKEFYLKLFSFIVII